MVGEGRIIMSVKALRQVPEIRHAREKKITQGKTGEACGRTARHMRRLLQRVRADGEAGLVPREPAPARSRCVRAGLWNEGGAVDDAVGVQAIRPARRALVGTGLWDRGGAQMGAHLRPVLGRRPHGIGGVPGPRHGARAAPRLPPRGDVVVDGRRPVVRGPASRRGRRTGSRAAARIFSPVATRGHEVTPSTAVRGEPQVTPS